MKRRYSGQNAFLLSSDFLAADNFRGYGYDYLWRSWYSFALNDTRDESAFLLENRDELAAMGYNVHFLPTGAAIFWGTAEPVLTSLTFNAALFSIVLFVVFGLVSFLYMSQRRREFAIMRALGCPAGVALRQILYPIVLLGIPAIITGGILGWFFALYAAAGLMESVAYAAGHEVNLEFPVYLLLIQIAGACVMMFVMVCVGGVRTAGLPVLELLQGKSQKRRGRGGKKYVAEIAVQTDVLQQRLGELPAMTPIPSGDLSGANMFKASVLFVYQHIVRSPVKSALTVLVALFFIIAFGLLQQGISRTEAEISYLYDSTVVSGELIPTNAWVLGGANPTILGDTVNRVLNTGFISDYYAEAVFSSFFVIPAGEDGNFPQGVYGEFWDEFWQYIRDTYLGAVSNRVDPLFAFTDVDRFLQEFSGQRSGAAQGALDAADIDFGTFGVVTEPIDIQFAPGRSWDDFVYSDPELRAPVPVILSDLTLQRRGLSVGDYAFIGHYFPHSWGVSPVIEVPVVIIGRHNGAIDRSGGRNAVLLPFSAMEFIRGGNVSYITFQFEVDTTFNREMSAVRGEIDSLVNAFGQGSVMRLNALLYDDELIMVADQMEQNLALLRLLYPVTIVLSVIIGTGLAALLLLQSAKTAAIMRVLGYTKPRLRAMLCAQYMAVAVIGVATGLLALLLLGINFVTMLSLLAGLYIAGTAMGSIIGAAIITGSAPLELLQVRE